MLYPVAIERGDDQHAFGVVVPDIAGCFSAGDSFEEALENVQEAIAAHLELLAEDNEEIPLAKKIDEHISKPEFKDYDFVWAVVDIDVSRYLGRSEKINVTLPSRLIHLIDRHVAKDAKFKSRSAFLAAGAERLLQ